MNLLEKITEEKITEKDIIKENIIEKTENNAKSTDTEE